jgi:TatA/E family protein of Tat protein translocase
VSIDIDTLVKRSARLKVEDLDLGAFSYQPLDPDTLRCLRCMHDVEGHTVCYRRDILVTRAHRDPNVTAFLTGWNYEEHWHGAAIGQVLDAHGEIAGRSRLSEMRRKLPKRDAFRPMMFHFTSAVTRHLTALQMTWGAVNKWTTQAGYARLAVKADGPVLGELLFSDDSGLLTAQRIDSQIDRLPGPAGLHLVENSVAELAAQTLYNFHNQERRDAMLAEIFGMDGVIVLLVVVAVLFGDSQIPKLAHSLGSARKEFKKGLDEEPETPELKVATLKVAAITAADSDDL